MTHCNVCVKGNRTEFKVMHHIMKSRLLLTANSRPLRYYLMEADFGNNIIYCSSISVILCHIE